MFPICHEWAPSRIWKCHHIHDNVKTNSGPKERKNEKTTIMIFTNIVLFQGIWCVGTIFGTGAGLTAFIFLIVNCIKDKLDDDPNT